jgi:hypothetical protein
MKMTPYETVFGKKPRFTQLYEFGSDVYVKIPDEKRRKLDEKAEKMKFVGYDQEAKGFRVADKNNRVKVSREIIFLKNKEEPALCPHDEEPLDVQYDEQENNELFFDVFEQYHQEQVQEEDGANLEQDDQIQEELVQDDGGQIDRSQEELVQDDEDQEAPRRSNRMNAGQHPRRLDDYVLYEVKENEYEPRTYNEAVNCECSDEWIDAMKEEIKAINDNDTWELMNLPSDRKAIGSRWVFKTKYDEGGNILRRKARLVAQGFSQKYGVDYDEVFAPVVRGTTFRMLLSLAGKEKYEVSQYDIKTAFLNGTLEEEIYMKQPKGFEQGDKVYRLKKSLYGLKQAARVWNETLHEVLSGSGCTQSSVDKCLYWLKQEDRIVYLLVHVDDMLVAYNSCELKEQLMRKVGSEFEMKSLGSVRCFLEIEIEKDEDGNFTISQPKYIDKIVRRCQEIKNADGYWILEEQD